MVQKSEIIHGFDGIKHLTLVTLQIMLFQKSSWLLRVIYVMILMGELRFYAHCFKTILPFSGHPRYKHDVGYRLSRSGLAIAYEQQVEFQGPIVQTVVYSTGSQTVNITYTAVSNIELRNPNGFEVSIFLFLIVFK